MAILTWLRLPFVIGYHTNVQNGGFHQDGFISAAVFGLALTSVLVGMLFAAVFGKKYLDTDIYLTFIIIFMACAMANIFLMCRLMCGNWKNRLVHNTEDSQRPGQVGERSVSAAIRSFFERHLTVVGMAVFFVLFLIHAVGGIAVNIICIDLQHSIGIGFRYLTIIGDLILLLYSVTLLLFCAIFHHSTFKQLPIVRYILCSILATTASMWVALHVIQYQLNNIHDESGQDKMSDLEAIYTVPRSQARMLTDIIRDRFFPRPDKRVNLKEGALTPTPSTTSTGSPIQDCPTAILDLEQKLSSLYPATVEFVLLALEVLTHLFSSSDVAEASEANEESLQMTLEVGNTQEAAVVVTPNNQYDEDTPLIRGNTTVVEQSKMKVPVVAVLCLASVIVMIIVTYLTRLDQGQTGEYHQYKYRVGFYVMSALFSFLVIGLILVAYRTASSFKSRLLAANSNKYSGLEILFVAASGSQFFEIGLDLIASVFSLTGSAPDDPRNGSVAAAVYIQIIVLITLLSSFFEIYLLTPLALHISRVKPDHQGEKQKVKLVILILAMYNFGVWLNSSFLVYNNHEIRFIREQAYGSNSEVLVGVLEPISLFYRFSGSIIFMNIFLRIQ